MIFCPECGSMMMPKEVKGKKVMACSCGYTDAKSEGVKLSEESKGSKEIEIVDDGAELDTMPVMDAECPKCGHDKAWYRLQQTRAADEPETKFLTCCSCKHNWRDYD